MFDTGKARPTRKREEQEVRGARAHGGCGGGGGGEVAQGRAWRAGGHAFAAGVSEATNFDVLKTALLAAGKGEGSPQLITSSSWREQLLQMCDSDEEA